VLRATDHRLGTWWRYPTAVAADVVGVVERGRADGVGSVSRSVPKRLWKDSGSSPCRTPVVPGLSLGAGLPLANRRRDRACQANAL
jgi:hypothetical protein